MHDELLSANADYARTAAAAQAELSAPPARGLAVVTCMDCRIDPLPALGLAVGDAHILRNAGGLVTPDVLRSLAISQRALGTKQIALIGHTECGMSGFDDASFRAELAGNTEATPDWDVPGFSDVRASVAAAVAEVRNCPWLPYRDAVDGYVFDVRSAQITLVD